MRYLFLLITIMVIWVTSVIMVAVLPSPSAHLLMYSLALGLTVGLYLIGFREAQ